jgi:hypothetical protein
METMRTRVVAAIAMLLLSGLSAAYITTTSAVAVQSVTGTWTLDNSDKTFTLRTSGSSISGTVSMPNGSVMYTATVTGVIYAGRGKTFVALAEKENGIQPGKTGPYCAAYAGELSRGKISGTYHDEDGQKDLLLTR